MKTIEFLDETKKKLGINTDTELSEALRTSRARIGHYRTGIRKPDEYICFRIAEILNMEPSAVISAIRAEGEQDPEKKRFWMDYAKKYGMVAVTIPFALAGITMLIQFHPANDMIYMGFAGLSTTHYAKLDIAKTLERLDILGRLSGRPGRQPLQPRDGEDFHFHPGIGARAERQPLAGAQHEAGAEETP